MGAGGEITPNDIENALRASVDSLVPHLLPKAQLRGGYWCIGNVRGDPGEQMKVNSTVGKRGLWTDWSEPKGTDEHSGDCLQLICVVKFGGWSMGDEARAKAIAWAKSWLGWDDLNPDRLETVRREAAESARQANESAEAERKAKRRRALAMWHGAGPIKGTAAQRYLEGRGIDFARLGRIPGSLRFLPDCWCARRRGKHPAMIACIMRMGEPEPVGVHRTFLDVSLGRHGPVTVFKLPPDAKGRRKSHKASLGPYSGGCIPLWKGASRATLADLPAGTPVFISEGIEDGLTIALARPEARVVAGVALSNMGGLELPPQAGPAVFIGQNDAIDGQAIEAFEVALKRQQQAAAKAKRPMPQVIWPEPAFKDFNDQLRGIRMSEAAL